MSTLKELRLQARLSVSKLAGRAEVDRQTINRAESGVAIQDVKAYAILKALSDVLGRQITFSDVDDLKII